MFACECCSREFSYKRNMLRHLKCCKERGDMSDQSARKRRGDTMDDVMQPPEKKQRCDLCKTDINDLYIHFRSPLHKNNARKRLENDKNIEMIKCAFKSRIATYRVFSDSDTPILTATDFMDNVKERVMRLINDKQSEVGGAVKVNLVLCALYTKWMKTAESEEKEVEEEKSFNSKNRIFYPAEDNDNATEETYKTFHKEISERADEFQERDSGWAITSVRYLQININKYAPLKGSSYLPLPQWIQEKRACVNVQNTDNACFFWSILSALYPVKKHADRLSSYPEFKNKLVIDNINIPVTKKDIKKFEDLNKISINIFDITGKRITGPIYRTEKKCEKHINLLFIENGEKAHYCWIRSLSRLVASQLSLTKRKVWICDGCLRQFSRKSKHEEHIKQGCRGIVRRVPSKENNIFKFKNYCSRLKVPVVVYADFEALLKPIDSCSPQASSSYTIDYQLHEPYSFGYFIKCNYDDSMSKYVSFRGPNCVKKFLESLEEELTPFTNTINNINLPMNQLTDDQDNEFKLAVNCHICGKELSEDRVRDHCHLTGEYRGPAHNVCNLNYKQKFVIPIVFHNLSKYDSHFIIRSLENRRATIVPNNKENFISFTIEKSERLNCKLRFIDSYRFMATSLDKLASNLDSNQFTNTRKHCSEHLDLMIKKGVFPYDYITALDKLDETLLPPHSGFFNRLNDTNISLEQYEHAQKVWEAFEVKTLGEYSDIYLKTDVLLLTDVFENFRNICVKTYQLDPAHYYTAPGLSWDAMLQLTKVEGELITDLSMIDFISNGIRGGLSQCCGRYARANNKYMNNYDREKPSNFIIYLDANNLYGWAMSQYLPLRDFRWLSESEIDNFDLNDSAIESILNEIPNDSATGYILEVDLDYPKHLHDMHNDFCFCPENPKTESKCSKLLSTLLPKQKYIIHYMNLKQAIKNGLVPGKVYRILAFSQSPWLKGYIDMNTKMRSKAKNAFEKDFYKLMNNAVYGKTMENVEKRVDVRLVNRWENEHKKLGARALISRLNFHSSTDIGNDLVLIQMERNNITYDKPIYVGFSVLELSKTLMYDFHYNYILPKYGKKVSLLYTDTDSFIYNIQTDDFYADIKPDLETRFDTSDLPTNIYNLPSVNKKVVGMFKDECKGEIIKEFIGIRSKSYMIRKENEDMVKKIKGVKINVVENDISREDFFNCVSGVEDKKYSIMHVIRSKAHVLYTQTLSKIVLNNSDDKRYSIPNEPFKTLAWGHFAIPPNDDLKNE